ncbi:MAG: winged helix-turn-helix transcriptional regulator [Candidatus Omnitrophica bacterium]|nr:winged helix-turn-helix transcriptional regulator [Candidatus Omnitrophota bacterium]
MFDRCIYFNLVTLTRRITRIWQEEFQKLGLSPSHGYLLFAVAEESPVSQKQLSEILELDASTVTRFVDKLISMNLVEKSSVGKGGELSVTPRGRTVYKQVNRAMDDLYGRMQTHFGKREFRGFVRRLSAAKDSLESW